MGWSISSIHSYTFKYSFIHVEVFIPSEDVIDWDGVTNDLRQNVRWSGSSRQRWKNGGAGGSGRGRKLIVFIISMWKRVEGSKGRELINGESEAEVKVGKGGGDGGGRGGGRGGRQMRRLDTKVGEMEEE